MPKFDPWLASCWGMGCDSGHYFQRCPDACLAGLLKDHALPASSLMGQSILQVWSGCSQLSQP